MLEEGYKLAQGFKELVSPSTIVNIERDQTVLHFRTIRKLAEALDVDSTSLLGE